MILHKLVQLNRLLPIESQRVHIRQSITPAPRDPNMVNAEFAVTAKLILGKDSSSTFGVPTSRLNPYSINPLFAAAKTLIGLIVFQSQET